MHLYLTGGEEREIIELLRAKCVEFLSPPPGICYREVYAKTISSWGGQLKNV